MTPGEQLVLLYEEITKSFRKAEIFLDDRAYDLFEDEMKHARDVIVYLNRILDRSQPIADQLENLYTFLMMTIGKVIAGRERKKDDIASMIAIVDEIREGFQAAAQIAGIAPEGTDERKVFI